MAQNNNVDSALKTLMDGMNDFLLSNSVIGEVKQIGDTTIIPLVDVSFGMGTGAIQDGSKTKASGGMGTKMTPNAVLVITNGKPRLINIKNQDMLTKIMEIVPDITAKFAAKKNPDKKKINEAIDHAFDNLEK